MHIIIDVTRLLRRLVKGKIPTGIDRVILAYIENYKFIAQALVRWSGRNWVLSSSQSLALFSWLLKPNSLLSVRIITLRGIIAAKFQAPAIHGSFLILPEPIDPKRRSYRQLIQQYTLKPIFFVHDLIPLYYPEYHSSGEEERYRKKLTHALTVAHGVITNSAATLHDLSQYAQQKKLNMPPASVALLAPSLKLATLGLRPLEKPYFLILSTIEPRKNHLLLLQIWRKLFQHLGANTPHLVIIGQRGWECENIIDLLDRSNLLKSVITEIAYCLDQDLVAYMQHCQALLFPSFSEGYGLPVLEALTLGVPVIASDLPVLHEIGGDIPEYVDPLDGKRWEDLIVEYTKDNSRLRAEQINRMKDFKAPSWVQHFAKVEHLLSSINHSLCHP